MHFNRDYADFQLWLEFKSHAREMVWDSSTIRDRKSQIQTPRLLVTRQDGSVRVHRPLYGGSSTAGRTSSPAVEHDGVDLMARAQGEGERD